MRPSEEANLTRFDGTRRGFYEVYFIEVQDAGAESGLWIRYTLSAPVSPSAPVVAELWAMYFDRKDPSRSRAKKQTVPFAQARVGRDEFRFAIGDAELTQSGCKGSIGEGAERIAWDLSWGEDKLLIHFPHPKMYSGPLPKSKVTSPHFDLAATGWYSAGDARWELDRAPGQQSHIWGTQHAHRWMWCHCNTFEGRPGVVFEALSAQVKMGPVRLPPLTLFALHYEDREYLFNSPAELVRGNESRTDSKEATNDRYPVARWIVGGGDDALRFRGEIWGDIDRFLGVSYKDPDGSGLVCSHNKLAHARIEIMRRSGDEWRVVDTLISKAVALEFVGRGADPRVPVLI